MQISSFSKSPIDITLTDICDVNISVQDTISSFSINNLNGYDKLVELSVVEGSNIKSISDLALCNCSSLTAAYLNNITSIGPSAFYNCSKLYIIQLDNISSIPSGSFYNCSSITNLNLDNVSSIQTKGLASTGLMQVNLPNIEQIGQQAFLDCNSLSLIVLSTQDQVPTLGLSTFDNINSAYIVRVKDQTYKMYIAAQNWQNISSHISSLAQPTVTFLSGSEYSSKVKSEMLNYAMSSIPPEISKVGYDLSGWDGKYNDVTADTSCYAKFSTIQYNIEYQLDGGVNDDRNPTEYNIESPTSALYPAVKFQYAFQKWTENGNQILSIEHGSYGDKIISTNYIRQKVTIKYHDNID